MRHSRWIFPRPKCCWGCTVVPPARSPGVLPAYGCILSPDLDTRSCWPWPHGRCWGHSFLGPIAGGTSRIQLWPLSQLGRPLLLAMAIAGVIVSPGPITGGTSRIQLRLISCLGRLLLLSMAIVPGNFSIAASFWRRPFHCCPVCHGRRCVFEVKPSVDMGRRTCCSHCYYARSAPP